jgi:hypothetical protein
MTELEKALISEAEFHCNEAMRLNNSTDIASITAKFKHHTSMEALTKFRSLNCGLSDSAALALSAIENKLTEGLTRLEMEKNADTIRRAMGKAENERPRAYLKRLVRTFGGNDEEYTYSNGDNINIKSNGKLIETISRIDIDDNNSAEAIRKIKKIIQ